MSTKKKRKPRKPMRRDIFTTDRWSSIWIVQSRCVPWLYKCGESWMPMNQCGQMLKLNYDLAPGECVELREVR